MGNPTLSREARLSVGFRFTRVVFDCRFNPRSLTGDFGWGFFAYECDSELVGELDYIFAIEHDDSFGSEDDGAAA